MNITKRTVKECNVWSLETICKNEFIIGNINKCIAWLGKWSWKRQKALRKQKTHWALMKVQTDWISLRLRVSQKLGLNKFIQDLIKWYNST